MAKIIISIIVNGVSFFALGKYLPGFSLTSFEWKQVLIVALLFTLLNLILKPILKLFLGPIIIITLGMGLIAVNMIILYILDLWSNNLSIEGTLTLLYASLITGVVNFVIHSATKKNKS